ncbi:hypothetical protein FEE96_22600 [Parasedimentitalea maritima]|uniref:Uncharacterized protein n=1 Tax=Parasedimentitalea maritima TaxID=2578117 RepID=A0ABY2UP58_9RHOB|nr:hypothetical protein [Zongyanglinia marina]TLP55510.1 hypothetical protein FEE96_22600 [Zongyanglinia marina]
MKRDKHRLILTGVDDAYAKRDAADDGKPASNGVVAAAVPNITAVEPHGQFTDKHDPSQKKPTVYQSASKPRGLQSTRPIQINYRLNLGNVLSERIQRLADAHDQPVELLLKGLRNKAAVRFKSLACGSTKPVVPDPAPGGLSIRYAAVFTGDMARNLNHWFDPFDLGVAREACKPILVGLFQEEGRALCDAMQAATRDDL